MRLSLRSFCLLFSLITLFLAGCGGPNAQVRRHAQTTEILNECATAYWHAVRWNYHDKAVEWLEPGPGRTRLYEYLMDRQSRASMNDARIYGLDLAPDLQTAVVSVTYTLIVVDEESVQERRAKQEWYQRGGKWYLKLTDEELKRLE